MNPRISSKENNFMRIGIDARLWEETGVGRYIRNLVYEIAELDKKNIYTLFFYKKFSSRISDDITTLRLQNPHWRFVFTDIRWHTIREQYDFRKVLYAHELDLVHFPYFSIPIFYSRAFVMTIHDLIINHFPTGRASQLPFPVYYGKHLAYQRVIKVASKRAKKVITVSEATKKEIMEHLRVPEEKICVTYEGVDQHLGGGTDVDSAYTNYFLFVGNAYPHKNAELLIKAFCDVVKEYPNTKLLFVGEENYFYKRLQQLVQSKGALSQIFFLGKVSDSQLSTLYANALGLVTPSLMEGFGLPGLEAMRHNCLVLASDIPVYREIYGDAALYFDPRSHISIGRVLREVLSHPKRFAENKKKGAACIKRYSWRKMAQETIHIYESCVGI